MDANEIKTEAIAAAVMAACVQNTRFVDDSPSVILPDGFRVESLERYMDRPTRKRGTTVLNDVVSFIEFVRDQKCIDHPTQLFYTIDPPSFTAVFNHDGMEPGWGDHRAYYSAPLSVEWATWIKASGAVRAQVDMAEFLEENMLDVVAIERSPDEPGSPDGARMLEICRTLEAKKKVTFKSSVRLPDGSTEFTYDEDVAGSAIKGTVAIPEQFSIGVPVFQGGAKYRQDVRFRYRIQDGGVLRMWVDLIRPHKVMEDAVRQLCESIAEETGLPLLNGTPANR